MIDSRRRSRALAFPASIGHYPATAAASGIGGLQMIRGRNMREDGAS